MFDILVSVIVPVYNVDKYIGECFESLSNQTYSNLQIIVVDDGSNDNSLNIIESYTNKFNEIIVLSQKNKGVSEARNLALKYAKGEYVLFVDPDDYLDNTMIEKLLKKGLEFKSDIIMCGFCLYYDTYSSKNKVNLYKLEEKNIYTAEKIIDEILNQRIQCHLWNKMFKKELLIKINFKFESGRYIQDMFPVFKAISLSKSISYVNESLYYYRQVPTSTIHKNNLKLAEDYYYAVDSVIKYINVDKKLMVKAESLGTFKNISMLILILQLMNANEYTNFKNFKISKYNNLLTGNNCVFNKNLSIKNRIKIVLIKLDIYKLLKNANNYIKNYS
ncbi:glycosyltransferase family 2 protein [Clostridium butyricum]|uniref:glycosyltransferase family 2 protein n=1 Tax=Clostridium butyricum TaxID=1492 RepID=UPI000903A66D|nr:glycosyltransferase [Clostridium butyricum]APF23258.1 glycosyltransferase like 2 family protein [Clostridium butyricum]